MRIRNPAARGLIVGALVIITLGTATGCASRYQAVTTKSPVFSSSAHGFSIQFPGKPSVHTFDNGDIDVTYRTGVSDYSVIAGTIQTAPTLNELPKIYSDVVAKVGSTVKGHPTKIVATSIDGVVAEHAVIIGGHVRQPWEYAIVVCGVHVYQFNTYGVKPADSLKYLASMHIVGKTAAGCN